MYSVGAQNGRGANKAPAIVPGCIARTGAASAHSMWVEYRRAAALRALCASLPLEKELDDAEIGERITDAMVRWLAQPANADYVQTSARPVAVFYDARAADDDRMVTSIIPRYVCESIAAAIYNPAKPRELPCKVYTLDPLFAASWCR